jgi:HD-GYP domain-containing protein (c-di-GMP phosphodiesterase class II)
VELEDKFWQLNRIALSFASERDVDTLFTTILRESMNFTNCDAGSLYVSAKEGDRAVLRFTAALNHSREFPFQGFSLPIDGNSIAGFVAYNKKTMIIENAEKLPPELKFKYNASFDFSIRYKTVNMLVVPLADRDGKIVGVLQLINKRREEVSRLGVPEEIPSSIVPFSNDEARVLEAIAAQAAMLIERNQLLGELKELPFSFIETLITALDSRDMLSSGHARRVAGGAKRLALELSKLSLHESGNVRFSEDEMTEIFYAGLLHDIGKIGVKESILHKTERLSAERMRSIRYKFLAAKNWLSEKALRGNLDESEDTLAQHVEEYFKILVEINSQASVSDRDIEWIKYFNSIEFSDLDGGLQRLVDNSERDALSSRYGVLSALDREVLDLHVSFSYDLLRNIRWPAHLARIPEFVKLHHERIDGSGFPEGLKAADLPIQARILALVDEYDNLAEVTRHGVSALGADDAACRVRTLAENGKHDLPLCDVFLRLIATGSFN